jgi:hypothetical protein
MHLRERLSDLRAGYVQSRRNRCEALNAVRAAALLSNVLSR